MKDLYIIGAGGFGREMFAAARDAIAAGADFRIAGFLDDRADAVRRAPAATNEPSPISTPGPTVADGWIIVAKRPPFAAIASAHRRRVSTFPSAVTNTSPGRGSYAARVETTGG